jgi:TP901 family phage tail tape measure protein
MADIAEVLLIFKGSATGALKSMGEVKGGMAEVGQSGNKLSGLGAIATGVATGLLVVGAVVAGVGAISLKMAGDFQQATTQLVTGAGEDAKALESVRQGILKMAPEVGQTPIELAKGLFMIESAGYHGAAGLAVLKVAAEGAKVGGADLATTADAVTTVMKDYKISAEHAGDATNFLVSVVAQGKTHMQDLAGSLSAILPTASALGVPLDQIGGAMATLTARDTPAANAATYLRFTLSALAAETPKGSKALEGIGLTSLEVGDTLTHKGLLPALQLVEDHLKTKFPQGGAAMFAALKDITGGTRGLGAALGLTGQNMGDFLASTGKVSKSIADGKGQVIGWDLAQKDFNVRLDQLKAGAEAAAIGIGTKLLPIASKVIGFLVDQTPKIAPFIEAIGNGIGTAVGIAGKAIGGAIDIFKGLPGPIQAVLSPVAFLILNFSKVTDAVKYFTDQLSNGKSVWEAVQDTLLHLGMKFDDVSKVIGPLRPVVEAIGKAMGIVGKGFQDAQKFIEVVQQSLKSGHSIWEALQDALLHIGMRFNDVNNIVNGVKGVFDGIGKVVGEVGKSLSEVWKAVLPALRDAWKEMKPALKELWDALKELAPLFQGIAIVLGAILFVAFKVLIFFLKEVLPAAIRVFAGAFQAIADVVKLVADIISGKWKKVIDDIVKLFQDFVGWVLDLWRVMFGEKVVKIITDIVDKIIGFFKHLWDMLIGHSIIPDIVNGIVNWFAQLPGRVLGAISGIPGAVAGVFGSIGAVVTGALGSLWTAITSAAAKALNLAESIGQNLVDGIKNGINNAFAALSGALHALAMLLPQPVKDALGIRSASTVTAKDIGEPFDQGIAVGIERSTASQDAFRKKLSGFSAKTSLNFSGQASGAGSGSNVEFQGQQGGSAIGLLLEKLVELGVISNQLGAIANQHLHEINSDAPSIGSLAASMRAG